jgi:GntR family transcriptional regulator, transcriptional repressor for pyruvate dehydrogenase complex
VAQIGQPERIADELIDRISKHVYPVGTKLPSERALAIEFEVSRPVVREALRMLAMLQLIDVQVGRGAFVSALPDATDALSLEGVSTLADVVDVREVLEVGALVLATRRNDAAAKEAVAQALSALEAAVAAGEPTARLDRKLHDTIIEASGSETLLAIWRSIEGKVARTIRVSPHGRVMTKKLLAEHRFLARGVINGAIDAAIAASRRLHADNRSFLADLDSTGKPPEKANPSTPRRGTRSAA